MATTKVKIINDLEFIRLETNVTFRSFGLFYIKLMQLPIEEQELIVHGLLVASRLVQKKDKIEIISFRYIPVENNEQQFRFIFEHTFICILCDKVCIGETNSNQGMFTKQCEDCWSKQGCNTYIDD